jgi:xanthine/CO dehydrogenase XdhC/CoxF family maturation factor
MKEITDIIKSYDEAQKAGKKSALATVVHVEGSSYRKPGARMLITEDGRLTGAISGGCLEGDALRKALLVMKEQRPMLAVYDTMDEDDATIGIGLGCNGIIRILIEPVIAEDSFNPIALLKLANEHRQHSVLVTFFSLSDRKLPQPGTQLLVNRNGNQAGESPYPELESALKNDTLAVLQSQVSCWKNFSLAIGEVTAFIEFVPPVITLVIAGAGNDVMPLVEFADIIGWETKVVDGRSNYAKRERFLKACQVLVAKPEQVLQQIDLDDRTVFALMTHNYNYDKAMLLELCRRNVGYIAMLGPKKKLARMLDEFAREGIELMPENLFAIHSPAGLDIGAETPEEIALSIVAEIKAHFHNKNGQPLRNENQMMHTEQAM